jgi:hypothetical protein
LELEGAAVDAGDGVAGGAGLHGNREEHVAVAALKL